jgi:hypothetical protein
MKKRKTTDEKENDAHRCYARIYQPYSRGL